MQSLEVLRITEDLALDRATSQQHSANIKWEFFLLHKHTGTCYHTSLQSLLESVLFIRSRCLHAQSSLNAFYFLLLLPSLYYDKALKVTPMQRKICRNLFSILLIFSGIYSAFCIFLLVLTFLFFLSNYAISICVCCSAFIHLQARASPPQEESQRALYVLPDKVKNFYVKNTRDIRGKECLLQNQSRQHGIKKKNRKKRAQAANFNE